MPVTAITATTEMRVAIPSSPALVNVPVRLWRVISSIAASHRMTIARVNEGHKAYTRTEVAGAMLRQILDGPLIGSNSPQDLPESERSEDGSSEIRSTAFLGTACR